MFAQPDPTNWKLEWMIIIANIWAELTKNHNNQQCEISLVSLEIRCSSTCSSTFQSWLSYLRIFVFVYQFQIFFNFYVPIQGNFNWIGIEPIDQLGELTYLINIGSSDFEYGFYLPSISRHSLVSLTVFCSFQCSASSVLSFDLGSGYKRYLLKYVDIVFTFLYVCYISHI